MFENPLAVSSVADARRSDEQEPVSLGWLGQALAALTGLALAPVPDGCKGADLIDAIGALESIKAAAAAAQARLSVAFDVAERERQAQLGIPAHRRGRGVAEQIALARRESPTRGSRHLGLAKALIQEMPRTWKGFASGELSEWRSTLVVQATAVLSREDRETLTVSWLVSWMACRIGSSRPPPVAPRTGWTRWRW